jgi:dipeptidyl aminopeptidase/acylaminoacyl peptidase
MRRRYGAPQIGRSAVAVATWFRAVSRWARLVPTLLLLAGLTLVCVAPAGATTLSSADAASGATAKAASTDPELIFSNPEFAFELRRTMSAIYAGEADLGECLATARRITDGDFDSWYAEWHATALHFQDVADRALARHHLVTARDAYYRIATYYRTAEFFLHGNPKDPRIVATWRKSRNSFVRAARLDQRSTFQRVWIPYYKTKLPGYFYTPKSGAMYQGEPRPLLIIQTGFDGCQEELHPYAMAAVQRGYNVLSFEGPGQGQVIRIQHLPMRPDWERVVRQVVNYAVSRPDVDPNRMALWGISLGGYLAPRGAAFDHRLSAVVADAGIYDVGQLLLEGLKRGQVIPESMDQKTLHEWLKTNPAEFNAGITEQMKTDTSMRWQVQQGMFVFRKSTPALMWAYYMNFSLDGNAHKIKCPTLVTWGDTDSNDPYGGQARELYGHLTCPKRIIEFPATYEAGYHCQLGDFALSWGQKFDWLDGVMHP